MTIDIHVHLRGGALSTTMMMTKSQELTNTQTNLSVPSTIPLSGSSSIPIVESSNTQSALLVYQNFLNHNSNQTAMQKELKHSILPTTVTNSFEYLNESNSSPPPPSTTN